MHEASIAASIIEIAEDHCIRAGYERITSISVRIGSASGILPHALSSVFEFVRVDTRASEAQLLIEEIPLGGICRHCSKTFTTNDQFILACPHCQSNALLLQTGREMEIKDLEVQ